MTPANFALPAGLVWALIVLQLLARYWTETGQAFPDTDDAMRLAQLNDWLAGQSWYDLHQWRVAPGYESHWSRLIDAGLGGTLWVFGLFFDAPLAERLMRTTWPMLWLAPTIAGMAAIAWRIAGREAAVVALLLALVGAPAFYQFRPGRIDHHNVQIALSVLVVAATVWSDRVRWTALAAGVLTGFAIGIGLECFPYLAVCGAAIGLRYAIDRSGARAAAQYGAALAISSLAVFLLLVGPGSWTHAVCDTIAINWIALVGLGGIGLAAASVRPSASAAVRLSCAVAIGAVATGVFLSLEPRCLNGPFAMMDTEVWSIWLTHVREMQPLTTLILTSPATGAAVASFPALALLATLLLLRDRTARHDFGYLVTFGAFGIAFVTMLATVKGYSYATWLGMPLVAAFALRLFRTLQLESLVPRFALSLWLTPAVLSGGVVGIAQAAGFNDGSANIDRPERDACFKSASYAPLAQLPAGVIATDLDFGPFLLALTPHSVVAAPYHRLSSGIRGMHRIFASPADEAHRLLQGFGATYVAMCGSLSPSDLEKSSLDTSLWSRLQANEIPSWLERVPGGTGPFTVYRVKS